MNAPSGPSLQEDEDNNEEVFLDESDIIQEVDLDNEDLPDADEESDTEQNGRTLLQNYLFGYIDF